MSNKLPQKYVNGTIGYNGFFSNRDPKMVPIKTKMQKVKRESILKLKKP